MTDVSNSDFMSAYRGRFTSLLQWSDLDEFWSILRLQTSDDWYLYAIGEDPPTRPATASQTLAYIDAIDALLRRDHRESYCGIVYTDSKTAPRFIKIYDPQRLGSSCGASGDPPLPGWILCRMPPTTLKPSWPVTENRRRWWRELWTAA